MVTMIFRRLVSSDDRGGAPRYPEILLMTLEQQLLGPVPDLQSRGQDEITWLPGLHQAFPPKATRKHLSYILKLDLIRLQADSLFEGLEKGVYGSVVNLYLFLVVGRLLCNRAEPVLWHFSGVRGRLSLVATADDLDASTLEPVEESFQGGAGHCADLVPDNHMNFCPILSGVHSVWPLHRKKLW